VHLYSLNSENANIVRNKSFKYCPACRLRCNDKMIEIVTYYAHLAEITRNNGNYPLSFIHTNLLNLHIELYALYIELLN